MSVKKEHKKIGFNVLMQRRSRGWTQDELSRVAGVSRARISDIEHGKESFTLTTVMKIANAFGMSYLELLR